jgi:UDP-glucose 6-dehydrogenase
MSDPNQSLFRLRIALVALGGPSQAQRRHVQIGMMRQAVDTITHFQDNRTTLVEAGLIDEDTAELVDEVAAELGRQIAADPDFLRESAAGPRDFLFGDDLETDAWDGLRSIARRAFSAVAGESSVFVSLMAK